MSPLLESLPVLIVNPYSRCNCRCVMCDIWKEVDQRSLTPEQFRHHLASISDMRVEWIVFSGGEPLMHPDIFELCRMARVANARVSILSTGLLLTRHAEKIIQHVDEVIVSLDGPERVHDAVRRVPGAFRELSAGVDRLLKLNPHYRISGRCTIQRTNCEALIETVATAREIGLCSISFLAVDLHTTAFNRAAELNLAQQLPLAVSTDQLPELGRQIEKIIDENHIGFVVESPAKLRKLLYHFTSYWTGETPSAPICNAPWTSAVLEATGVVRPCFFQPPLGKVDQTNEFRAILNGPSAMRFRASLDVASNPTCQRCVCSLNWKGSPSH